MLGLSWKRIIAIGFSVLLALLTFSEVLGRGFPVLQHTFPDLFQKFGLNDSNIGSLSPAVTIGVILLVLLAALINSLLWPVYRYVFRSKAGEWFYVVQNVRPRIFDAGESVQFDALHGLKEARLVGHLRLEDNPIRTLVRRANVYYYDNKAETLGDYRGCWKTTEASVSTTHMRLRYSIEVERKLDGERETSYTGYYLLEPSKDVEPLFGIEVWEGVVFTVNQFGGMFGLVYAERIEGGRRSKLARPDDSVLDMMQTMFKRVRTPSRERYVNEPLPAKDKPAPNRSAPPGHSLTT